MKKSSKRNPQMVTAEAPKPEEVKLNETEALRLALVHERAEHAITVAKQRDAERAGVLGALQAQYGEGGKYVVVEIDANKGTLKRITAEEVRTVAPAPSAG